MLVKKKKLYLISISGAKFSVCSFVSIVSASIFIWNPEVVVKAELRVIISFVHLLLSKFSDIVRLWVGVSPVP